MARYKFQCSFCLEDRSEPRTQVRIIGGDAICSGCTLDDVVPRFATALQTELEFPPRWGPHILEIDDFGALVPAEVRAAWPIRLREYKTPVHNRVYCSHLTLAPAASHGARRHLEVCGKFLGSTETSDQFQCPKCNSWSKDHHLHCPCAGTSKQQGNPVQAGLDKRTRGVQWQRCPKSTCGVVIERSAGCNHMVCGYCMESFCFVCGSSADADSDHWYDTCPRFGQPGDKNASYDQDYSSESDDADDDGDADDEDHTDYPDDAGYPPWIDQSGLESPLWPGRIFLGAPFTIPDPNASPREQLQHDLNIAIAFNKDFEEYIFTSQGRARRIPESFLPLINHVTALMYTMSDNLKIALKDMTDDEPTTDVGRDRQAMSFSDFRIGHNRLRHGFVDAYNNLLSLVRGNSVFFHLFRSIRLYREILERYMILHAPRFLFNLTFREWDKDRLRRLQ